jgi:hypothetical protein
MSFECAITKKKKEDDRFEIFRKYIDASNVSEDVPKGMVEHILQRFEFMIELCCDATCTNTDEMMHTLNFIHL